METEKMSTQFLSRLGNEVRQTLYHLTGWLELAAQDPLSESQEQYFACCRESADRLLRIANDLEELARAGAGIPNISPFSVREAIGEVAELMSLLAERNGLELRWTVDDRMPALIDGNRAMLQDILRRLTDNAIRFSDSGMVRISATATPVGLQGSMLEFAISDSGQGITEDVISDLDLPVSEPRLQGLGLRIVRKRVAEMGGNLWIESEAGTGSTIRFAIPVETSVEASSDTADRGNGNGQPPLRMLVVEDSDDSFRLFESYTRGQFHLISRARNGAEAFEMAKSGEFDFIVMDVNMPVMDGYTATRLIREWETKHGQTRIPILLLSADELEKQMRIGGAAGCSGYLTKPTNKTQVLAAIEFYATAPAGR
jgi:CheY-like chemotaxis protein